MAPCAALASQVLDDYEIAALPGDNCQSVLWMPNREKVAPFLPPQTKSGERIVLKMQARSPHCMWAYGHLPSPCMGLYGHFPSG